MTMKKILAAVAATAIAGSAMATMAFAANVIDFENGAHTGIEMFTTDGGDASVLSIVDFNGSKALKVDVQDCTLAPKVKFLVNQIVPADKVNEIAKIEMDISFESKDGVTPPGWCGGAIGGAGTGNANPAWAQGADYKVEEYTEMTTASVKASMEILPIGSAKFVVGDDGAHFLLQRWPAEIAYNMYIDNVVLYDFSGNAMELAAADAPSTDAPAGDTSAPAGGANTGVAPVAAIALTTLAGAALIASKKR